MTDLQLDSEIRITSVTVAGNERTKLSFFDSELQGISSNPVKLSDLAGILTERTQRLTSLNIFEKVDTNLVIGDQDSHGKFNAELKLSVKEKGVGFLSVESYVKTGASSDIGAEVKGALRNPLGYGEMINVSSITNLQSGGREFLSTLTFPHVGRPDLTLKCTAKSSLDGQSYFTAIKQRVDAVTVELNTTDNRHQIIGEYGWRDEIPQNVYEKMQFKKASDGVNATESTQIGISAATANTAVSSIKTSLKYLHTFLDNRDSASNPSEGSFLQGSLEVAVPPGNNTQD